jgi:hypothetical protein
MNSHVHLTSAPLTPESLALDAGLMQLDFTPRKPIKCKHCGLVRGQHRAKTYQCPAKWSKGRAVGYTHFLETVFEPKPPKDSPPSEA